jgi:hypothetical protein
MTYASLIYVVRRAERGVSALPATPAAVAAFLAREVERGSSRDHRPAAFARHARSHYIG